MSETASATVQGTPGPNPIDTEGLCILSLDGGGVRGLSSLYVLKSIMDQLNMKRKENGLPPVKPCEVFNLIGGTSTGGLIAILLGRLEMDVDECIKEYIELTKEVFAQKRSNFSFTFKGKVNSQFSSEKLRTTFEKVLERHGIPKDAKFKDGEADRGCKVIVCTTGRYMGNTLNLRSYDSNEQDISATICDAALATSAAPSFFDAAKIEGISLADGGLGANNPAYKMEREATDIWCPHSGELKRLVKCFISIGTGNPGPNPFKDSALSFLRETVLNIATETESTAQDFIADWRKQYNEKRYFRFNVEQGLGNIGLEEYNKAGEMREATLSYLRETKQVQDLQHCTQNLSLKESVSIESFS